jgi:hypothetical protein
VIGNPGQGTALTWASLEVRPAGFEPATNCLEDVLIVTERRRGACITSAASRSVVTDCPLPTSADRWIGHATGTKAFATEA